MSRSPLALRRCRATLAAALLALPIIPIRAAPTTQPATQPAPEHHGPIPQPGEKFKTPLPARRISDDGLPHERLADEADEAVAKTPTTHPSRPSIPPPLVPWSLAGKHVGETIIAEGKVIDTHRLAKICFLNFSNDRGSFYVVIFEEALDSFPRPPQEFFLNKTIRVTGRVYTHDDRTQVRVRDGKQIEVVP